MKESLNKNYNFVSKFVTLEDQEDSVNFDEIIAVAPPPIGRSKLCEFLCLQNSEICKFDRGWEIFHVFLFFDPTNREKQFQLKRIKCHSDDFIR